MDRESYIAVEQALRLQRHEFINHIQVVHAMLELGRVEKAMRYIEDLAKDDSLVEEPLRRCQESAGRRKAGS